MRLLLASAVACGLWCGVAAGQVSGCTAVSLVSTVHLGGTQSRVAADDGWVIVSPAGPTPTIRLYDASDPEQPALRSSRSVGGYIYGVSMDELVVAVIVNDSGASYGDLLIYDWTSPGSPVLADRLNSASGEGYIAVCVDGDRLYATNSERFFAYDISDPSNVVLAASRALAWGTAIEVVDGYAFVASSDDVNALTILDVRSPSVISQRSRLTLSGDFTLSLAVGDGVAYIVTDLTRVSAIDVSNLSQPFVASIVSSPESMSDIAAKYNALYVVEQHTGGLHVYDMVNPASPRWIDSHDPPTAPQDVAFMQGTLAVADGAAGMRLFQVSDCSSACRADLAEPTGVLDFFDLQAFLVLFGQRHRAADLDVNAAWDVRDLLMYLGEFAAGCPSW